jgi:hypothetical protein
VVLRLARYVHLLRFKGRSHGLEGKYLIPVETCPSIQYNAPRM